MIAGLCLGISVIYDLTKLLKPQTQHAKSADQKTSKSSLIFCTTG